MTTLQNLRAYEKALAEWKRRDGLKGGGGEYDRIGRKYNPAPEPLPEAFNLTDAWLKGQIERIRKKCGL